MLNVLSIVRDGVEKPTRIMYAANMSWNPTKKILEKLVGKGFLGVTEEPFGRRSKKRYVITEKGIKVLKYFYGAQELISL
jgi:predicted transcriptional regulator